MRLIVGLLAAALLSSAAQAQSQSGASMLPSCRQMATGNVGKSVTEAARGGGCAGMVGTLLAVGPKLSDDMKFCPPPGSNLPLGLKVFVKFLEDHPDRQEEPTITLALAAFREAWACKN